MADSQPRDNRTFKHGAAMQPMSYQERNAMNARIRFEEMAGIRKPETHAFHGATIDIDAPAKTHRGQLLLEQSNGVPF